MKEDEDHQSKEIAWWVSCLPQKHENLSSIPYTNVCLGVTMTVFPVQGDGDRCRQTLSQKPCKQTSLSPNKMEFEMGNMDVGLLEIEVGLR